MSDVEGESQGRLRTTVWRGREVTYEVIDGWAVHDGDILLGRVDDVESRQTGPIPRRELDHVSPGGFWRGGVIPYEIPEDATNDERADVDAAIAEWNARTAITFVPREGHPEYVRLERTHGGTCSSGIGRGSPTTVFTLDCGVGTIVHELGHAVGLGHEHQRTDRDEFVMLSVDYRLQPLYGAIAKWEQSRLEGPYDYASAMHYGLSGSLSIPPGIPLGRRHNHEGFLSEADVFGVNRLYGELSEATVVTTQPPGLEVVVDGVRVATPATFYWDAGTSHVLEAPLWHVRTGLLAPQRYLFGRWSDSGERIRDFTVPSQGAVIQASFIEQRMQEDGRYGPSAFGAHPDETVFEDLFEGFDLTPRALTFVSEADSEPPARVIRLTHRGEGPQSYAISSDSEWLAPEPPAASLAPGASVDIEVRVLRDGLRAGAYRGELRVRPMQSDETAADELPGVPVAHIVLSKERVSLGEGGEVVPVAVSDTEGWLGADGRPLPGGGRVRATNGDSYVLARGASGITATFEPGSQTLRLPGGGEVTLAQRGKGDWRIGEERVRSGHRYTARGHEYVLELMDGGWRVAPYAVRTVAGRDAGPGPDGIPAVEAVMPFPFSVAVDAHGGVLVTERSNHAVRKIDASGTITTLAGTGQAGFGGDGGRANASLMFHPRDVAVDASGNLYVTDSGNHRVRKIDTEGTITTLAGTGEAGFGGDGGAATNALLDTPSGLAVDAAGNVYVADLVNHRVRRIDIEGTITTLAGTGDPGRPVNGALAAESAFTYPAWVAVDSAGSVYVTHFRSSVAWKIDSAGIVRWIGPPHLLSSPEGVAVDAAGNLYVADSGNHRVRKIDAEGTITTLAGTGDRPQDFRPQPAGMAVDGAGNVYLLNSRQVRKVDPLGTTTSLVRSADSEATEFAYFTGLALGEAGSIFVTDELAHLVWKIDASGTITTVAGTGEAGYSGDGGAATEAQLDGPRDVAVDAQGNVYIADVGNDVVRKIDSEGTITTLTGGGIHGIRRDGGPATAARLGDLCCIAADGSGNVFVVHGPSPYDPFHVRKIDQAGTITRLATLEGYPQSLAVDGAGRVYVSGIAFVDGNHQINSTHQWRIWMVEPREGRVEVITGDGHPWFSGDGVRVSSIAADASGNVWFAADGRVQVLERLPLPPEVTVELPGGGAIRLSKQGQENGWRLGEDPVESGYRYVRGGTEHVLSQVAGQWRVVALKVPLGTSGSAAIKVLADGTLVQEPSGRVVADGSLLTGPGFESFRLTVGPGGVTATPVPQRQQLPVPGGAGVALALREDGTWQVGGTKVHSGGHVVVGGREYTLDRFRGQWHATPRYSIRTVAGTTATADGVPATEAILYTEFPSLAVDALGNVFIADRSNHRIWKVDVAGIIRTAAGTGLLGYSGDGGPATAARLAFPVSLSADSMGNVYFADHGSDSDPRIGAYHDVRIRRIDAATGSIETLAPMSRVLRGFSRVAADPAGRFVYWSHHSFGVRRIDTATGQVEAVDVPHDVGAVDAAGNLYGLAHGLGPRLAWTLIDASTGEFEVVEVGDGTLAVDAAGNTHMVSFFRPQLVADTSGNVYFSRDRQVMRVDPSSGAESVLAGTGNLHGGWYGGLAETARLGSPRHIAADGAGNLFVTDQRRQRVWKLDVSGTVSNLPGYSGHPTGVAVDATGDVYVSEGGLSRVWRLDTTGTRTLVAGTGAFCGDAADGGPATSASLCGPSSLAVDAAGNLYVSEFEAVRKIDKAGIITTVTTFGDRELGRTMAVDAAGNLYVSGMEGYAVLKVDTVTGNKELVYKALASDGPEEVPLELDSLAVDDRGSLYIGQVGTIRVMDPQSGFVRLIGGTGQRGFTGDADRADAAGLSVGGMTVDRFGAVWFTDPISRRIRVLEPRSAQN